MPTPKHVIELDIDGTWTDISSDVEQFISANGKDKHSENVPAGSLALTLRNADEKYTPSNPSSILYPYHRPGIKVRGFMVYPYDALDDDGTGDLDGRAVGTDGNFGNWDDPDDAYQFDGSNELRPKTSVFSDPSQATVDFGEADVWAGVKTNILPASPVYFAGALILRWVDADNYVLIEHNSTTIYFRSIIAGSIDETVSVTFADILPDATSGDYITFTAKCDGPDIYAYVDNNYIGKITLTDSSLIASTNFGIGSRQSINLIRFSDFGGWKPFFEGRTVRVDPRPSTRKNTCFILCNDDKERQQFHRVFTNTAPPESAGDLVDRVLDATGVSEYKRIIDDGDNLSTDSTQNRPFGLSGLDELRHIEQDSVGLVWIDGAGCYHFEDWDHRLTAPHDEERATWTVLRSDPPSQDDKYITEPLEWNDGIQLVENEILYEYIRWGTTTGNQQIWRMPEADTSYTFAGRPQFEDDPNFATYTKPIEFVAASTQRASSIIPPVPGTDILINGEEDGTGVDLLTSIDSNQGTVSFVASGGTFTMDDTGQDFTAAATALDGVTHTTGYMAFHIIDNSGRHFWAWGAGDDPDGDGTKVSLLTRPPGHPDAAPGFAAEEETFVSGGSYTYTVHAFGCYFQDGIDGSFVQLGVIGPDYYAEGTTSTAEGAWITDAKLRADVASEGTPAMARSEDPSSQLRNGRRRVQVTTKHIDRYSEAKARSEARKTQRSTERERLSVGLVAGSKANLQESLYRDISDRIHVTISDMGIDGDYYIDRVIHKVELHSGGAAMRTEFDLTRTSLNQGWGYVRWGEFVWT